VKTSTASQAGQQSLHSMTIRELLAELARLEERRSGAVDGASTARADAISSELRQRRLALRESTVDA
jgi:hypothetical protein